MEGPVFFGGTALVVAGTLRLEISVAALFGGLAALYRAGGEEAGPIIEEPGRDMDCMI